LGTTHYGIMNKLKASGKPEEAFRLVLIEFLQDHGIKRVGVPYRFPSGIYRDLLDDFEILIVESPVSKWRAIKSQTEIEAISCVQKACQYAMQLAIELISKSKPNGEQLRRKDEPLTSEQVRGVIEMALLERGCDAVDTIVAGGLQAVNPHTKGNGPLPANEPIVIDIFPRSKCSKYFGDMTRTVVRGEASAEVMDLYKSVLDAQLIGLNAIKAGISGKEVHSRVCQVFNDYGYAEREGKGFTHSTGHGVGLSIHERPSLNETGEILEVNNVVTVEPGLYYPDIGGVRLEDLVIITANGCDNLTNFEKRLMV
ncbi:MAG: Xaa-Pro peptidase family protein, partial [Methanotrichaceae archaeon]|nr:Xaa-Pro peptidase family protein [Methanotrichaceae archaeon]